MNAKYRPAFNRRWSGYARGMLRRAAAASELRRAMAASSLENGSTREGAIRDLLTSARETPYWCGQLVGEEFPAHIPPLTKAMLRESFAEILNPKYQGEVFENSSGGSTGEPTRFLQTWSYRDWAGAIEAFQYHCIHPQRPRRKLYLWGALRDVGSRSRAAPIRAIIEPVRMVNCFVVDDRLVEEAVHQINTFRPTLVIGYATALSAIARRLSSSDLSWSPPAIVSGAATLYDHEREIIAEAFRAPVFNRYGGREIGGCGLELPGVPGMVVPPMSHLVEVMAEDGRILRTGRGRLLVTPLKNLGFPMLRFAIGDVGEVDVVPDDAPVCRGWQRIVKVEGRDTDHLNIAGRSVDSLFFVHVLGVVCRLPQLDLFQVLARPGDELVIRLKMLPGAPNPPDDWISAVEQLVQSELDAAIKFQWEIVPDIPPTPSGKHRYVIQEGPST